MGMITTEWRSLPSRGDNVSVRATYGFRYINGNSAPYFSITSDIKEYPGQNPDSYSGGYVHKEILEAFPDLGPLVRWHLVDQTGSPMHYVANGKYWYDQIGKPKENSYDADPLEAFKSTVVFGACTADSMEDIKGRGVKAWCEARADNLRSVMLADMELFSVELIPGDWPKP